VSTTPDHARRGLRLSVRVPTEEQLRSPGRSPAVAARVGLWLGICFGVAFLTGLYSHVLQDQPGWFSPPTRPVWLYRVTQGVHYLTGVACVPLLLVKLYAVYPKLFARPPRADRRALLLHGLERGSIGVLVASAVFQVATGLANASQWYPWAFSFRATHYAVAWVVTGALLVHVAVKLPVIRAALGRTVDAPDGPPEEPGGPDGPDGPDGLSRRGLLATTGAATGLAVLSVAGGSVPLLREVSVFANHHVPGGGVPINKTARRAGVQAAATAADYALVLADPSRQLRLTRADLLALPQHTARLPIACVEGWSASGDWSGVRLRDLRALLGRGDGTPLRAVSLQAEGPFRGSDVPGNVVDDPLTLVALGLDGEPLSLDHGFPCRLVAPGRPGVLQTKWLGRLEVLA
jgi:hypothetical protein